MLTPDQILSLAPDDSSAKAAKGLLAPAKWPTLGSNDAAIWGECQGSGSKPYQVSIDLAGPTFKCTCPSRKFPCKHGLAVYLLRAQKADAFTAHDPPPWVAEWLASRQERAEKKVAKAEATATEKPAAPPDPEAAAKQEAKRLDRMRSGARDLERWLADLVKHGFSDLSSKPATFWKEAAARLVDAQATGLAAQVRLLEEAVRSGAGWPERALAQMGRMQLLIDALGRFQELPENLRAEVRAACGWPLDREAVLAQGERLADTWFVQGQSFEEVDRLWERRVWLQGRESRRQALLLDFSHGQRRYEQGFVTGAWFKATLAFFPGQHPLRALLADAPQAAEPGHCTDVIQSSTWDAAFQPIAQALSGNPWLQRLPLGLAHCFPTTRDGAWLARDEADREIPLQIAEGDAWQLIAMSGGAMPMTVFGEWNGTRWRPVAAWTRGAKQASWTETVSAS
jgi:hypothetical protein